jgi:pyruvate carboxylase
MAAPQQPLTFTDVFDDDDEAGDIKEAPTIHHIRANSSIMQLKKILVANRGEIPIRIFRTAHELSLHTVAVYRYLFNLPKRELPIMRPKANNYQL